MYLPPHWYAKYDPVEGLDSSGFEKLASSFSSIHFHRSTTVLGVVWPSFAYMSHLTTTSEEERGRRVKVLQSSGLNSLIRLKGPKSRAFFGRRNPANHPSGF